MYINKPFYLVLGMIAAASVVAAGAGFATPVLASTGGDYEEKYLRCYEYPEKNNEHTDYDYAFKYKNYWYYCWDYDNNKDNTNGGGYKDNNNGGY
jgi:hypothetical protein